MHAWQIILLVIAGGIVLSIAWLFISAALVDFNKEYDRETPYYWFLLRLSVRAAVWGGRIRVRAEGTELLPDSGTFLLVQNHRSSYDPIITWRVLEKRDLLFVSKTENRRQPVFGKIIHRVGCLYIDRENVRESLKTIREAAEIMKEGKYSVAIYPEGTRSKTEELLPFHNGVFKAAQKAGVPIVVTVMSGSEGVARNWPLKATNVTMKVVEVIQPSEHQGLRTEEIGERVKASMERALGLPSSETSSCAEEKNTVQ